MSEDQDAVPIGSAAEATAAVARFLAVTGATYERRAQLEHALTSRILIEQAKGILAERHGIELDDAFKVIRAAARSNRIKLHDLVARVQPSKETPREIVAALERRRDV